MGKPRKEQRCSGVNNGRLAIIASLLIVFGTAGNAQAQGVTATVDRSTVSVRDRIHLTITVDGDPQTEPELPKLDAFQVRSQGTSRQIQFVNGRTTSQISFNYLLQPTQQGTFEFGPVEVKIGGELYKSAPFKIRVQADDAPPGNPNNDAIFARASVSNKNPYLGQQIIYTLRLFRRVELSGASVDVAFDGFTVEELGEQTNFQRVIGGKRYEVHEFRRALFAQEDGKLTIKPGSFTANVVVSAPSRRRFGLFDDFFGRREVQTREIRSNPIEIDVQPLPPAPSGFSGLVGHFKINAQLSKLDLPAGDSTTLTVTISGAGNVHQISEPEIPKLDQFKVYRDKASSARGNDDTLIRGSRTFRLSLVPLAPGEIEIPGIPLLFFNPDTGKYVTRRSKAKIIQVRPPEGKEDLNLTEFLAPSSGKVAVKVLGDDILPIYTQLDALKTDALSPTTATIWSAGIFAPPLAFFLFSIIRRRKETLLNDEDLRRKRSALRTAQRSLNKLKHHSSTDPQQTIAQATTTLREFLGDQLACSGRALTPQEASTLLEARRVSTETVRELRDLLELAESLQYGAPANGSQRAPAEVLGQVNRLVKELNRSLRS